MARRRSGSTNNTFTITGDGARTGNVAIGDGAVAGGLAEESAAATDGDRRGRIFISHAHADAALVQELVDLLRLGAGIDGEAIFASSLPNHTIPGGEDYLAYLRSELQDSPLVVLLITQHYLESSFCTCELGAVWALGTPSMPLLVPPSDLGELDGILRSMQVGRIDDARALDELRDRSRHALGITRSLADWDRCRAKVLRLVVAPID